MQEAVQISDNVTSMENKPNLHSDVWRRETVMQLLSYENKSRLRTGGAYLAD